MIILENKPEPKEAFHYKAPDDYIREKYGHIFNIEGPLESRIPKYLFDSLTHLLYQKRSISDLPTSLDRNHRWFAQSELHRVKPNSSSWGLATTLLEFQCRKYRLFFK